MILIRRAEYKDAESIITTHDKSIREICSRDYTPEEIEAWAGRNFKPHLWCQAMDRDFIWVVELNSQVRGFGHLAFMDEETCEVMGLFFTPELKSLGAGKELFRIMKSAALFRDSKIMNLRSTLTSKSFYEKVGFKEISGDRSIEMRGVQIPSIPMELRF